MRERILELHTLHSNTINTSVSSDKQWVQTMGRVQDSQRLVTTLDVVTAGATKREAVLALHSD